MSNAYAETVNCWLKWLSMCRIVLAGGCISTKCNQSSSMNNVCNNFRRYMAGMVTKWSAHQSREKNGRHFADERHFRTDFLSWFIINSDNGLGRTCLKTFIRTNDGMKILFFLSSHHTFTRLRTKWFWISQIANFVGVLSLSKQTGSVHIRFWMTPKSETHIPTTQVPVWLKLSGNRPALNESISRANRIFGVGFVSKLWHLLT